MDYQEEKIHFLHKKLSNKEPLESPASFLLAQIKEQADWKLPGFDGFKW